MRPEKYELASLIDLAQVRRLCDSLTEAFGIGLGVLDLSGHVLIASGWQDVCTHFHREHPETQLGCRESDLRINRWLAEGQDPSEHYEYRCSNGLWDVAFPLVVAGQHLANVYTGQFFFDDDEVDREAFAERARRLGFDETAYLEALDRVPVITHEQLRRNVRFVSHLVVMLGELGMSALEHDRKHSQLKESEERYRRLFNNATEGFLVFQVERDDDGGVKDLVVVDLNLTQVDRTRVERSKLLGRRRSECSVADERLHSYFEVVAATVSDSGPSRCEVYLPRHGTYESLSVYPASEDLWVLSATDVTEQREAEQALRRQEERIRQAYVDVLDAVTGGKLILLTEAQLAAELGTPHGGPVIFREPSELAAVRRLLVRAAEFCFPGCVNQGDLLSSTMEALDNAIKHARGGTYQVFTRGENLQIAVTDEGPGIDFRMLPRATLVSGFSTAASLGMGFTIMLQLCERVLLATRPGHTVVALELPAVNESTPQEAALSSG